MSNKPKLPNDVPPRVCGWCGVQIYDGWLVAKHRAGQSFACDTLCKKRLTDHFGPPKEHTR